MTPFKDYTILVIETAAEYKSFGTRLISIPEVLIRRQLAPGSAAKIALPLIVPVSQQVSLLCVEECAINTSDGQN